MFLIPGVKYEFMLFRMSWLNRFFQVKVETWQQSPTPTQWNLMENTE
jgi:hypothetical protein